MILHVLQFADQPLTVQEIARRIGAEFNESATSEQVTDSIESSLLPAGRLVFEQGLCSLPEDALPATTEDLAVALTPGPGDKATWQRVLAEGGYDDCGRSLIFDRLVPLGHIELDFAYNFQRRHLRHCANCRDLYPELNRLFLERDTALLQSFTQLVKGFRLFAFQATAEGVEHAAYQGLLAENRMELFAEGAEDDLEDELDEQRAWLWRLVYWRHLLLAASVGREFTVYSSTHENSEGAWAAWRQGIGDAEAVKYVQKLTENQFAKMLLAENCADIFRADRLIDASLLRSLLPNLARIGGDEFPYDHFEAAYAPLIRLSNSECVDGSALWYRLLASAIVQAEALAGSPRDESLTEVKEMLRDMKDQIDSNSALQMPVIVLLERVVKLLGEPSKAESEEYLRQVLGGVYSLLCPEAQSSLVTAEQLSRVRDLADPSHVVVAVAKAFEAQLMTGFLKPFCRFLVTKGLSYYPVDSRRQLLRGGRLNDSCKLFDIAGVLDSGLPEVGEFAKSRGVDLASLAPAVREVSEEGGKAKHRNTFSADCAKRLKEKWLRGAPFGDNIFAPPVKVDAPL